MEELLEGQLLNGANFLGKCLGVVWDLIRKHNQKLPRKVKKKNSFLTKFFDIFFKVCIFVLKSTSNNFHAKINEIIKLEFFTKKKKRNRSLPKNPDSKFLDIL